MVKGRACSDEKAVNKCSVRAGQCRFSRVQSKVEQEDSKFPPCALLFQHLSCCAHKHFSFSARAEANHFSTKQNCYSGSLVCSWKTIKVAWTNMRECLSSAPCSSPWLFPWHSRNTVPTLGLHEPKQTEQISTLTSVSSKHSLAAVSLPTQIRD